MIDSLSTVGPGAILEKGVSISESVIWPGARVEAGAELYRTIVRGGLTARGALSGVDC